MESAGQSVDVLRNWVGTLGIANRTDLAKRRAIAELAVVGRAPALDSQAADPFEVEILAQVWHRRQSPERLSSMRAVLGIDDGVVIGTRPTTATGTGELEVLLLPN